MGFYELLLLKTIPKLFSYLRLTSYPTFWWTFYTKNMCFWAQELSHI